MHTYVMRLALHVKHSYAYSTQSRGADMAIRKADRTATLSPLSFRGSPELRAKLEQAASRNGRSLTSEVLSRLETSFAWEATKQEIAKLLAEAAAQRTAARIQAIREAGFQIVREAGGGITVNISPEMLHGEADSIMRSGFVDAHTDHGVFRDFTRGVRMGVQRSAAPTEGIEAMVKHAVEEALREQLPSLLAEAKGN